MEKQKVSIADKFEEFNQLLLSITEKSTYKQKKYAKKLLEEIYNMVIFQQNELDKYREHPEKVYTNLLFKSITILQLMGFTQIGFDQINDEFLEWFTLRIKKLDIKKIFTWNELNNYRRLYELYKMNYEKEPEKLIDLKKLITEYELEGFEN